MHCLADTYEQMQCALSTLRHSGLRASVVTAVAAGIAAFLLTIGAIALEGARFGKLGIGGVFGWLSREYLLGIGCDTITCLYINI